MKILHLADVHLDRPFVGLPADEARARRADLLGTFRRCLEAARGHGVDAVTIGGDLWERSTSPWTRGVLSPTCWDASPCPSC